MTPDAEREINMKKQNRKATMKAEGRAMFYWRKNSEWDDKRAAEVMAKRLRAAGYKARVVKKFCWRVVYKEPVPVGGKPSTPP